MKLSVSVEKRLGDFRLDVAFESEGGILALLGASGSGKSMTLKCIAGIETPDRGRIVLDGRVLFDSEKRINLPPQKRGVGYLFQNYALFPNLTVQKNIEAGVRGSREEKQAKALEFLRAMRLEGEERKLPRQLSGGQQQRVALARILAGAPRVILLDEPFTALDSYLQWQLEMELQDTLAAFGGLTLFVSHNRDEVYRLCERVCVVDEGRSSPVIPVSELFDGPDTLSAALLTGCKNYSAAEKIDEHRVRALDWGTELRCERPVPDGLRYVAVRAHYVRPVPQPGENVLDCRVTRLTQELFSTAVMLCPEGAAGETAYSFLRAEMPKSDWAALAEPSRLLVHIAPADILLLR